MDQQAPRPQPPNLKYLLIALALVALAGCGGGHGTNRVDRAQKRSIAWRYGRLLTSAAQRTLTAKAAHSTTHARAHAVSLAKQTKEVENELNLYSEVGLSKRTKRRYNVLIAATKRRVASGALSPEQHIHGS